MPQMVRSPLLVPHVVRARLMALADTFAIATAVALPWSVSATSLGIALWLLAVMPTLDWREVRGAYLTPAGGLPALLAVLALAGMVWSAAPLDDQFGSFKIPARLAIIAIMLVHFRRSERGGWALAGFLGSCALLMAASWLTWFVPAWAPQDKQPGVPVNNYIVQSAEFLICAIACAHLGIDRWRAARPAAAAALLLLAALFLADIIYVATGRSALVTMAVLLPIALLQRFRPAQAVLIGALLAGLIGAGVLTSGYIQSRVVSIAQEVTDYRTSAAETSSGYRLEFWKRSVGILADAPIIGHGTGSQREQFRRTATEGIAAAVTDNPHNQILLIAVQFGGLGTMLLLAMWIAHWRLFSGAGTIAWIGSALVVQNVVMGLFNSSLLDFGQSWLYMCGVGVLGGVRLRADREDPSLAQFIDRPWSQR